MRSRTFCVIWATAAPARNRPASPTKARAALLRRAMLAHQQVCGGGRRLNSRDARLNDEVCGPMDPAAEHRIPRGTRARAPAALEASDPGSGGIAAQGRAASGDIPRPLAPAAADQNARETWTRSCGEIQSGRRSHHPWTERVRDVGVSVAQHVQNRAARGSTHWVMDDAARRSLHIIRVCGGRHHQMGAIPGLDDEDRGRAVPAVEYSTRGGLRARGAGELEVGDLPSGENYDARATDAGSTPRPIKRTRHTNVRWQKLTAGLRANAERAPLAPSVGRGARTVGALRRTAQADNGGRGRQGSPRPRRRSRARSAERARRCGARSRRGPQCVATSVHLMDPRRPRPRGGVSWD